MNDKQSNQSQEANPERLAATDEAQRTQQQGKDQGKQIPTGNEREEKKTDGTQAGMGE